jgi:hypothetical protein
VQFKTYSKSSGSLLIKLFKYRLAVACIFLRSCPTLFLNKIFEGFLDENQIKNQVIVVLWAYFLLQFVVKNRQKDG